MLLRDLFSDYYCRENVVFLFVWGGNNASKYNHSGQAMTKNKQMILNLILCSGFSNKC